MERIKAVATILAMKAKLVQYIADGDISNAKAYAKDRFGYDDYVPYMNGETNLPLFNVFAFDYIKSGQHNVDALISKVYVQWVYAGVKSGTSYAYETTIESWKDTFFDKLFDDACALPGKKKAAEKKAVATVRSMLNIT